MAAEDLKFQLHIYLGNAAMLTYADVAAVLRRVAQTLEQYGEEIEQAGPYAIHPIRDLNGNPVGSWRLKSYDPLSKGGPR